MGKWLSGSSTRCVKSYVLNTQSPLKARHAAPVHSLSFSVMRAEPEEGEPLKATASVAWAKTKAKQQSPHLIHGGRQGPPHVYPDTHMPMHTQRYATYRGGGEKRGRKRKRDLSSTYKKLPAVFVLKIHLFQEFERLLERLLYT